MGIAVTAVYKYADAITKTLASTCTAAIIMILNYMFFGGLMNVVIISGTCVCMVAMFMYLESTL